MHRTIIRLIVYWPVLFLECHSLTKIHMNSLCWAKAIALCSAEGLAQAALASACCQPSLDPGLSYLGSTPYSVPLFSSFALLPLPGIDYPIQIQPLLYTANYFAEFLVLANHITSMDLLCPACWQFPSIWVKILSLLTNSNIYGGYTIYRVSHVGEHKASTSTTLSKEKRRVTDQPDVLRQWTLKRTKEFSFGWWGEEETPYTKAGSTLPAYLKWLW